MRLGILLSLLLLTAVDAPFAAAQTNPKKKAPEPIEVTLNTKDGVELVATYYGSPEGKEAVPVLMLHAFGQKHSRADYHALALELQKAGHAVLVPDLRGHGASTKQGENKIGPDKVERAPASLGLDVEECKKYLLTKHRAEELNIDRLVIVAAEEMCVIAINYAALDWSFPPLGSKKQGQDVKALVLLSPTWAFKAINVSDAIQTPALQKAIWGYCIVGKKNRGKVSDCKRVFDMLERSRKNNTVEDLFLTEAETQLQGTEMLKAGNLGLSARILKFIELSVKDNKEYNWKER